MTDGSSAPPDGLDWPAMPMERVEIAMRWRLVLGRFADEQLGYDSLNDLAGEKEGGGEGEGSELQVMLAEAEALDGPLEYIYDREYAGRSHRSATPSGADTFSVPAWLGRVRELFPKEAAQILQQDALTRYGMTELVSDAEILRSSEPTEDLLRAIVQFKHMMRGDVLDAARDIVREVVERIAERLLRECRPALTGARDPQREHPPVRSFKNIDWRRTIGRNLKNWDTARGQLVVERLAYHHRTQNRRSYRIIVAVDQSGSMTDSLIHSAVMAAIFASLPMVSVDLVLWDHRVFDVSHLADDPMEVLMSCQLGGGTQMLPAMQYCAGLIAEPDKTIFVLISDWFLFGEAKACLSLAHDLHEAGVTCIGLNALDLNSAPVHDELFAKELAGRGWLVASMTPKALAEHIGELIA